MGFTQKQERNGATGDTATRSPEPGPMPDVAPLIAQAQDVGLGRGQDALAFFGSPAGAGPAPSSNVADSDRVLGGADGNIWEWDDGLAVSEMPGEA